MHWAHRFFGSGIKISTAVTVAGAVFFTTVAIAGALFLDWAAASVVQIGITAFWLSWLVMSMIGLYTVTHNPQWMMRLLGSMLPMSMPVKLIDYTGEVYYSLAWHDGEKWTAPVYYGTGVGEVHLHPSGHCDGKGCSYIYLWEPLRPGERAYFFLVNSDYPGEDYFDWDSDTRYEWVRAKRKEHAQ